MSTHGDSCFCDDCLGESTKPEWISQREELARLVAAYVPTGDDILDTYNRERIANGEPSLTREQFSKPLRTATETELQDTSVRTRYATPGQRTGNGYVRLVSGKQKSFIRRLMSERDTTNLVRLPGSENLDNMSLAGARDLITRLLCCPELPETVIARSKPKLCSVKQWEWLRKLTDREATGTVAMTRETALSEASHDSTTVTARDASAALDVLFNAPRIVVETPKGEELREGVYRCPRTGDLIKAYLTRGSRQLVGARWELFDVPEETKRGLKYGEFVYEGKRGLSGLTLDDMLSIDEAKAIGAEFHYCCVCGIELTNADSIEAGIGPICASKF